MKRINFFSVLLAAAVIAMVAGRVLAGDGMPEPDPKDGSPNFWSIVYLIFFLGAAIVVSFKSAKRTRVS